MLSQLIQRTLDRFKCDVKLIGIPLSKEKLKDTNLQLQKLITFEV
jgi:hypothetical protein